MMVPLNDPVRWTHANMEDLTAIYHRVLNSGQFALGKEVAAFEMEFAAALEVTHCLGVGNGTDALQLALRAVGVKSGDEVATVANAGMYATSAILSIGARPIFVDIDPKTLTMATASLKAKITARTRAVVVTHLYGFIADMQAILSTTESLGVPVIEDCAHAHGAKRGGCYAGGFGAIGCFSFYPTKNLGALGDGGALVTHDPDLAERISALRQYGWRSRYVAEIAGGCNSRLDEIQAAILRYRLDQLDSANQRRRAIAIDYRKTLKYASSTWQGSAEEDHAMHLCVIRSQHRQKLSTFLTKRGITNTIHYPLPDHRQPVLRGLPEVCLPETERATAEILTLPCFPEMSETEIKCVKSGLLAAADAGLI